VLLASIQAAGTILQVTAEDEAGNTSLPTSITVIDKTPPSVPKVNVLGDNSTTVTGTAEKYSTIKVLRGSTVIGTNTVKADGTYSVTIVKQAAGTILQATAADGAGNKSAPINVTVIDKTPPSVPKINVIGDNSTIVTGTAEKYSTIKVLSGSTVIGTNTVKADGTYSVTIVKQVAGTLITVTANDKVNNVSLPTKATVIDKTAPTVPVVNTIGDNSKVVTGKAEKYAVIKVKRGTTIIGTGSVNSSGVYSVTIPLQKMGTVLSVTATDKAGNTSIITQKTVVDKTAPSIPSVNSVYSYHTTVKGKAEAYSYITVKRGSIQIGYARSDAKGNYTVKILRQKRASILSITVKDKAGNISKARQTNVR
jgi:hypothetical protein